MPDDVRLVFGRRLRALRRGAGLTQAHLAERAGLAPNTVGTYERGEKAPRPRTLEALAEALDCTADHLAFGTPERGFPSPAPDSSLGRLVELLEHQDDDVVRLVVGVAAAVVRFSEGRVDVQSGDRPDPE